MANERFIVTRTKQVFFGITVFGIGRIETKELQRAIEDLIEGWAKRHDYGVCALDFTVKDTSKTMEKEFYADIAKKDQAEAAAESPSG